ncbi:MAG: hypothetical protein ACI841_004066 [Planctomycetota bacterium]|jgi:hypothetical protein
MNPISHWTHSLPAFTRAGVATILFASSGFASSNEPIYQTDDGLVVIEFESLTSGGHWATESSIDGYTGDSYLRWDGPNYFNEPGHDTFGVNIEIYEAGTYNLRIRNRHDHPDSTEANDVFTRMDGGDWQKTFSAQNNVWTWGTRFEIDGGHPQAEYNLSAGVHRLEFSGRSLDFIMDRFHLFTPGHPDGENENAPESDTVRRNQRPLPRISVTPSMIAEDDNHSTVITLDSTGSIDLDEGQQISFRWQARGARFVEGTRATDPIAKITVPGGHAFPIRLEVRDNADIVRRNTAHTVINIQDSEGRLDGPLVKWHTLKLTFRGAMMEESDDAPNPFLDRRLNVTFQGPQGQRYVVPGFFNGNGQGHGRGRIWQTNFAPDAPGIWSYVASFRKGNNIAIDLDPAAGEPSSTFDGATGSFLVQARDDQAPGFLSKGRLEYVGEHYMKHADGDYYLKGGTDSPENLLGFQGFDDIEDAGGLGILHEYANHVSDWEVGDPTFESNNTGVTGKGLIGALNYLGSQHVNSVYFLPMNLGGDGQDTHPFLGIENNEFNKTHYDISRMQQWGMVFEHAQRKGILLHFVLAETETANENWLDNGNLGKERKLFFRELIARFGSCLALKWNLCEENDYSISELEEFATYIDAVDPYSHPIAVHTHPNNFQDYFGLVGNPLFTSTSIQFDPDQADDHVELWREQSEANGRKWIIDMDENNPWNTGLMSHNTDDLRKRMMYDVYFSGGQVEWYFGYHNLPLGGDMRAEDFRTRQEMWEDMWHARNFMQSHLPFWEMEPRDSLLSGEDTAFGGGEVFTKLGEVYAIYLPDASNGGTLNLSHANGPLRARWFNPRTGEFLPNSEIFDGGTTVSFDPPPVQPDEDWVLLVK